MTGSLVLREFNPAEKIPMGRSGQRRRVLSAFCSRSWLKEVPVSPTVMSRWGTGGNQTPFVIDEVQEEPSVDTPVGFIKNDAGGEQQGFWGDTFPTIRSGALPAVAYNVTFCDANGTRKDRPNGGLYVTEADTGKTVTANGPNTEMVVVDSPECVPLDLRNATRDPNKSVSLNRSNLS